MGSTKTTAPAFPLLSGDWLKGTTRLSAAERGYYLDLLLYTWDADEPLPADETEQMQIARCTNRREWKRVWLRLRPKWYEVDGGFKNKRLEAEREKLRGFRRRKADAGKNGAEKRWHADGKTNGTAIAEPMATGWPSISSSKDSDSKDQNQSPAPTRELLTLFDDLHKARLGSPADINSGKDGATIAKVFKQRGRDETESLIRAFFALRDPWVVERGFSVGIFKSQIPKLLSRRPEPRGDPRVDWREECERLHEGRCTNPHFHAALL